MQFVATVIVEQDRNNEFTVPATRIQRESIKAFLTCQDCGTWKIPPGRAIAS